ncbi:flagellar hook-associated protein FlgK [Bacillus piscicola]|uniref:flagellar hook-associated protein FlgK n=1 Tax=Bacillus piscicola TaxID=1632684 RepID=UPI001F094A0D|nr:flagellar hook-associated protein FlgK [Bacillus piscicola]
MYSTFHGLETARRALSAQQAALYTTGNNISNVNTEGYSRQRVNLTQSEPFPSPGLNAPRVPGQIGTGVSADFVQRIRENYLDIQYRGETAQTGYWETRHDVYTRIEDLMNEPSENGIARTMDKFWQSLQVLAVHPEDSGARSVVRQRGIALAKTITYISDSLQANKKELGEQINTTEKQVNSLLEQINNINQQISRVEPHGFMPNKLYDERDLLIDELSGMMNIEVERNESKGQARSAAEGTVSIYLLDESGNRLTYKDDSEIKLVNGEDRTFSTITIERNEDKAVTNVSIDDKEADILSSPGKVKALIEAFGYEAEKQVEGTYPDLMNKLDEMVSTFTKAFNEQHEEGYGLNGETGVPFFDGDKAGNMKVSDAIMDNLDHIAAASPIQGEDTDPESFAGDGSNALALSNVKDAKLEFGESTTNVQSFYQGIIGEMAVDTSEAGQMKANSLNLQESIDHRRKQVSSVSLDEELTNVIQFQHAYNAAARNITMIDEMLDRIINNMGVVGR